MLKHATQIGQKMGWLLVALLAMSGASAADSATKGYTGYDEVASTGMIAHNDVGSAPPAPIADSDPFEARARLIFRRLTGVSIYSFDPRLFQMKDLLAQGKDREAAAVATGDPAFYQNTLMNFSRALGSKSGTPHGDFSDLQGLGGGYNDFDALLIGSVLEDRDARELLTAKYLYQQADGASPHVSALPAELKYSSGPAEGVSIFTFEASSEYQGYAYSLRAGLLTTKAWSWNYEAGTNRRAVVSAFDRFLCKPLAAWTVPYLDEAWIARDIDRNPGGDHRVFQKQCRTCHGSIDPMRDAFSAFHTFGDRISFFPLGRPAPKYDRGAMTYPQGHVTVNDRWFNPIAALRPELGIQSEHARGSGAADFGKMLAHSTAFNSCMAQRAFTTVCGRAPQAGEDTLIDTLAKEFESDGRNLKRLFQRVATQTSCLTNTRVKDFRSFPTSLAKALQVSSDLVASYVPSRYGFEVSEALDRALAQLPQWGRPDEVTPTALLGQTAIASHFCKRFSIANPSWEARSYDQVADDLSLRLYGRKLSDAERAVLVGAMSRSRDRVTFACTALASSYEFLEL